MQLSGGQKGPSGFLETPWHANCPKPTRHGCLEKFYNPLAGRRLTSSLMNRRIAVLVAERCDVDRKLVGGGLVMRSIAMCAAAAVVFCGTSGLHWARGDDCAASNGATAAVAQNPQWFNGRWWYWGSNGWLVWTGDQWVDYRSDAGRRVPQYAVNGGSAAAGRSFSYQGGPVAGSYGYGYGYGGVNSSRRMNIDSEAIDGSYGVRAADAKALGNYH
jgi:hypothetical protein